MDRILILEDHPMMADAVGQLLKNWLPGLELVYAHSLHAARAVLEQAGEPLVLVLTDLQLSDSQPEHTLRSLRHWAPVGPIVAFSMLDDSATQQLCQQWNVALLSKATHAHNLQQHLHQHVPLAVQQRCCQGSTESQLLQELTPRQRHILAQLAQGSSNREIATRLGIAVETVHAHVRNLFEKLQVKNRTQASKMFLQLGGRSEDILGGGKP